MDRSEREEDEAVEERLRGHKGSPWGQLSESCPDMLLSKQHLLLRPKPADVQTAALWSCAAGCSQWGSEPTRGPSDSGLSDDFTSMLLNEAGLTKGRLHLCTRLTCDSETPVAVLDVNSSSC